MTVRHDRLAVNMPAVPTDVNAASKKNFLYRMLFSDIY